MIKIYAQAVKNLPNRRGKNKKNSENRVSLLKINRVRLESETKTGIPLVSINLGMENLAQGPITITGIDIEAFVETDAYAGTGLPSEGAILFPSI